MRRKLDGLRGGRGLARITAAFRTCDTDGNGVLDTFELAHAVARLFEPWSPPSWAVAGLVAHAAATGAAHHAHHALSLLQFVHLVHTFNWDAAMAATAPQTNT